MAWIQFWKACVLCMYHSCTVVCWECMFSVIKDAGRIYFLFYLHAALLSQHPFLACHTPWRWLIILKCWCSYELQGEKNTKVVDLHFSINRIDEDYSAVFCNFYLFVIWSVTVSLNKSVARFRRRNWFSCKELSMETGLF